MTLDPHTLHGALRSSSDAYNAWRKRGLPEIVQATGDGLNPFVEKKPMEIALFLGKEHKQQKNTNFPYSGKVTCNRLGFVNGTVL